MDARAAGGATAGFASLAAQRSALKPSPAMIVDSISDVVEVLDPRGVITYSNLTRPQQAILGLDNVLGRQCHLVYEKVCTSCSECPLDQVLVSGKSMTQECQVSIMGGRRRWVRQHLYPILDAGGAVSGVVRMVFDITREKRRQARDASYLESLEQSLHNRDRQEPDPLAQALSAREREVLSCLVDGMSNPEIARLLGISPNTVKTHVVHIFNKLGVTDRTQAAVAATKLDLI